MKNGDFPIEIVDLPIKSGDFQFAMLNCQRVYMEVSMVMGVPNSWKVYFYGKSIKINLEMDDLGVPPCMETPVIEIYPLLNIQKAMENHHYIMSKSTISIAIFNSELL